MNSMAVFWLLEILSLQIFSFNLRTYTVRLFCIKFVKWCWLKENSSDKGCFKIKKNQD